MEACNTAGHLCVAFPQSKVLQIWALCLDIISLASNKLSSHCSVASPPGQIPGKESWRRSLFASPGNLSHKGIKHIFVSLKNFSDWGEI